jgi:hypothetical protein
MMKKALLVTLLVVSMNALAYKDEPTAGWDANPKIAETINITWRSAPDATTACNIEAKKRGMNPFTERVWGCQFSDGPKSCLIITDNWTSLTVLGHEVRHCYQGAWHGK